MGDPQHRRTTREKVAIFRACFSGLEHVYGTYDPRTGRVRQVKQPVTDRVILDHLLGRQPYGVYLLVGDRTHALAVDFDAEDLNPPMKFVAAAKNHGLATYIERSKSKGYHVWMFFEKAGVKAAKARLVAQLILREMGTPMVEVFPKQDRLDASTSFGNFINAPLFGRLVPAGRSVFINESIPPVPHQDQWQLLANVRRVPEAVLDAVLKGQESLLHAEDERRQEPPRPVPAAVRSYGLPSCARRMLAEGVGALQRVACFRLAVQLKKAGLPRDIAVAALRAWAVKNRPTDKKRIISDTEVAAQTTSAYVRSYRGCGCGDPAVKPYCDPSCWLRADRKPTNGAQAPLAAAGHLHPMTMETRRDLTRNRSLPRAGTADRPAR
jgi:hypothetical protein